MSEPAAGLGGGSSSPDGRRGSPPSSRGPVPGDPRAGWGSAVPAGYGSLRAGASPLPRERGAQGIDRQSSRRGSQAGRDSAVAGEVPVRDGQGIQVHPKKGTRKGPVELESITVSHVNITTVIRVSLMLYLVFLAVVVIAAMLLWVAADQTGVLTSIDKSVRSLFSLKEFVLHASAVAEYTAAGGAVLAVAGTLLNVVAALIYNLIADIVGGISMRTVTIVAERTF